MASKRKQDEKHLAILRSLVKLEHNKQCFDCNQRGPTYVNMTIGSFVCTACSGQLRGLNPPHRVKSISMASFTPDEVDFVKSRGNDFCRKVWLGLYNSSQNKFEHDVKDDNKIRDFMTIKYEKKRFYIAPTEEMIDEARRMNEPPKAEPATKPLRSLGNIPNIQLQQNQAQNKTAAAQPSSQPAHSVSHPFSQPGAAQPQVEHQKPAGPSSSSSGLDLLGDLGGDPFTAAPRPAQPAGGFADFSAFGGPPQTQFQGAAGPGAGVPQPSSQPMLSAGAPPMATASSTLPAAGTSASDRYSALAELDSVFGATTTSTGSGLSWDNSGWAGSSQTNNSFGPASTAPTAFSSGGGGGGGTANPFGVTSSSSGSGFLTNGNVGQPAPPVGGWALPGMTQNTGVQKPAPNPGSNQPFQAFPQSSSFPATSPPGYPASSQPAFQAAPMNQPFGGQPSTQPFGSVTTGSPFNAQSNASPFGATQPFGAQQSSQNAFGGSSAFGAAPQGFGGQQNFAAAPAGFPGMQQGFYAQQPPQQPAGQGFGPPPGQHIRGQFMGQWGTAAPAVPAANPFMSMTHQGTPPQRPLNSTNPFL